MIVTKDEMSNAAIGRIREHGYENVNIPMICQKCGVTKGSFYHHFRSKDDLITYWLSRKIDTTVEFPADLGQSPKERLLKLLHEHALVIQSIGCDIFYHAMVADMNNQGINLLRTAENTQKELDLLSEAIEAGEITGEKSARDLLGCYIMTVLGAIMEWKMAQGTTDIVENLDNLAQLIFR